MLSNLVVIQHLSRQIADSLAKYANAGDSVQLTVRPAESTWYLESSLQKGLINAGRFPTQSPSAPVAMDVGLLDARVSYSQPHRQGVFGAKELARTVTVQFTIKVIDKVSGMQTLDDMQRSATDTVTFSDIELLETPGIPATKGSVPSEGFFSLIFEPLVAVGAIAVALYLLFHVRS